MNARQMHDYTEHDFAEFWHTLMGASEWKVRARGVPGLADESRAGGV
jgi:hypothetical protein